VAPKGPATCAGRKKCPVDAPICIDSAGKLQCVAMNAPAFLAEEFQSRCQCTRQDDCHAGDACSYTVGGDILAFAPHSPNAIGTFCAWIQSGMGSLLPVCDLSGPNTCPRNATRSGHCVAHGSLPWMGVCD
jgi:hypothetical protein